jgi:hypothetical protein
MCIRDRDKDAAVLLDEVETPCGIPCFMMPMEERVKTQHISQADDFIAAFVCDHPQGLFQACQIFVNIGEQSVLHKTSLSSAAMMMWTAEGKAKD